MRSTDRRAAVAGLGVVRLDQRDQTRPRHKVCISARKASRLVGFLYFSKPIVRSAAAARLICFITTAFVRVDSFNACNYDAEDLISESLNGPFDFHLL
jgi:hypothetical protein